MSDPRDSHEVIEAAEEEMAQEEQEWTDELKHFFGEEDE